MYTVNENVVLRNGKEWTICKDNTSAITLAERKNNPPIDLSELIAKKLKENANKAQATIETAFSDFPQFEIDTFASQQRDYEAYLLDNNAPTPFVDGILLDTETKPELMTKIGGNIAYIQSIQKAMRQNEKDIKACTTIEQLNSIDI